MKIKSLKYNFFMATIRMMTGILFPILIMPYINRVFNPVIIGKFEYANTIVTYFVIFTYLGIPTYGVREVSRYKNSKIKLSIIFMELLLILIITNIVSYLFYFLFIFYFEKNIELKFILYLFSINILFTTIGFEWFYQGIENQEIITKRAVLIRIISIVLIFIFIKEEKDFIKYILIYNLAIVGGNLFNLYNLKKYIVINRAVFKRIYPVKHLKSILIVFSSSIAMIIYGQMDIIMLGKLSSMKDVGIYSTSIKFIRMLTSIIPLFGTTLLPRLTNLYYENKIEEYESTLNKSLKGLLMYSILGFTILILIGDRIIQVFAGENYLESIVTLRILAIITILSGISYFLGIIILYSQKKEKIFLNSLILAAFSNLILNYLLIPQYKQNGAAVATIFAEILVILSVILFYKKYLHNIKILTRNNFKYFIASFMTCLIYYLLLNKIELPNIYLDILIKVMLIITSYLLFVYIFKEDISKEIEKHIRLSLKKLKTK
ncbi:MAG: flippase [Cetobacterium sp.]|uniref:flippase n=1 Tax=Cetobacterium sp. TaxID=2071632 RepID=UPI003F3CDD8A